MERDFIVIHKSSFLTKVIASISILLCMFVIAPKLFDINKIIIGTLDGDAGLYYYLVKYIAGHFFENSFFQTSMYYPYGYTLAWSDCYILPGIIVKIFSYLFSFNTSFNLCYLLSRFLNGFSFFLILYLLTGSRLFSILPAMLFTYNLSLYAVMHSHPQLQFFFFIPFSFYFFLKFLAYKRKRDAFFIGFLIFLSFLCSAYYAIYACILMFFSFLAVLILKPKYINFDFISKLFIGGVVGILPIVFLMMPYLQVKNTFGVRHFYEPYFFSTNLLSYITSTCHSILYNFLGVLSGSEAPLFAGFVILFSIFLCFGILLKKATALKSYLLVFVSAFAISGLASIIGLKQYSELKSIGDFILPLSFLGKIDYLNYLTSFYLWVALISLILLMRRLSYFEKKANFNELSNKSIIAMMFFLCFVFYFLSYGPLGGEEPISTAPTGLYAVLYWIFPGVDSLRATGRLGQIVIFFMFLLFAFNFYLLSKNNKKLKNIFIVLCVFCFIEELETPIGDNEFLEKNIIFQDELKSLPKDYAVFYLPLSKKADEERSDGEFARYNVNYMIKSVDIGHKTINGYSGHFPNDVKDYHRKMLNFPDEKSVRTLSFFYNLKYVVYDGSKREGFNAETFEKELALFKNDLKLLKKDGDKYLIEYIGEFENRETYFIKVPKYLTSVRFAIKTENSPENKEESSIEIINKNNNSYVGSITPIEDGVWHEYEVPLTKTTIENKVSPYRLLFKGKSTGQKIFLRSYQDL